MVIMWVVRSNWLRGAALNLERQKIVEDKTLMSNGLRRPEEKVALLASVIFHLIPLSLAPTEQTMHARVLIK